MDSQSSSLSADENMSDFRRACSEGSYEDFENEIDRLGDAADTTLAQRDGRGWLAIHDAANGGNQHIIAELLRRGCSPVEETAREKDTPIHIATANGHQPVVLLLLEKLQEFRQIPSLKNRDGNTPLHLACEKGRIALVSTLNERFPGHSIVQNRAHRTPLQVAAPSAKREIGEIILKNGRGSPAQFNFSFQGHDDKQLLDTPLNIHVVGERRAGKSTLITTLQQEKRIQRFWGIAYSTLGVPEHGMGVVPTEFNSRFYGRVVFHDFASGSDYIHENLIKTEEELSSSIFILVIDSRPDKRDMEEKLEYWLNIITAQCKQASSPTNKPNLIIVSSFADYVKSFRLPPAQRLSKVTSAVKSRNRRLVNSFNLVSSFWLDCRRAFSPQLDGLQKSLKRIEKPSSEPIPCYCYFLSSLLKDLETSSDGVPALKLQDLSEMIHNQDGFDPNASQCSSDSTLSLYELLPQDPSELLPLCQYLHDRKRLLLLKENPSDSDNKTWIIHGLHKMMGLMEKAFSSTDGSDKKPLYLIDDNKLQEMLSTTISLPKKILITLVEHFKLHDSATRELTGLMPEEFFIPSLLPDREESEMDEWEYDPIGFGWTILPKEAQECQFFLPRLQKLLLNCLLEFCTKYNFTAGNDSIWKEGFSLTNEEMGICVIINKKAITLNVQLSANESHKFTAVEFRNAILKETHIILEKIQPELKIEEFLIPKMENNVFPVQSPRKVRMLLPVKEIRAAIRKEDTEIQKQSIQSLILFEPCSHLRKIDRELFSNPTEEVSRAFLEKFMESFTREEALAFTRHFDIDINTLTLPDDMRTYGKFLNRMNSFSIFEDTDNFEEASISSTPSKLMEEPSTGQSEPDQSENPSHPTPIVSDFTEDREYEEHSGPEELSQDGVSQTDADVHSPRTINQSSLTRQRVPSRSILYSVASSNIPFEVLPQSFEVDSTGMKIDTLTHTHGITIEIPAGAVPDGSPSVKLECGVTLPVSGPFCFPQDVKPVSPVLWLCIDADQFEFSKPIEITLPHHINCSDAREYKHLGFYKATHSTSMQQQVFSFKKVSDSMQFQGGHGKLYTKHSCFLCICTNNIENLAQRSSYCLINVTPKEFGETMSNAKLNFCVTYFVGTCIQTVREQYPEEKYDIDTKRFLLQPGSATPGIQIHFDRNPPSKWLAGNTGGAEVILASEIDYTKIDAVELKMQEHNHVYPPRFTIKVTGNTAEESSRMQVSFTGVAGTLNFEVLLPFVHQRRDMPQDTAASVGPIALFYNNHTTTFMQHINMTEIYPHVCEVGLLTKGEQAKLVDPKLSDIEKAQTLHHMLTMKGRKGMEQIMTALQRTTKGTGHRDIIEALENDPEYNKLFR